MNERIKELANQAKFMAEETINRKISANPELYAFAEKLAELIVQECIAQARKEEDRFCALGHSDLGLAMENYQELLKNHFGVES